MYRGFRRPPRPRPPAARPTASAPQPPPGPLPRPSRRVALTIVLNGRHHLEHKGYAESLASRVDAWCIVEGASGSSGTTAWCKRMPDWSHADGRSVDGTTEYLATLAAAHPNVTVVSRSGMWTNKDEQVNAGLDVLRTAAQGERAWLWQIDCDEQWSEELMASAEADLAARGAKTGMFLCEYHLGPGLRARGDWGEGRAMPYNRLWNWAGERFASHEPPSLEGGNGVQAMLPQRFEHYAYHFEQDVRFKDAWYGGHEGILDRWRRLQSAADGFPRPIGDLITGPFGRTNTTIVRVEAP